MKRGGAKRGKRGQEHGEAWEIETKDSGKDLCADEHGRRALAANGKETE